MNKLESSINKKTKLFDLSCFAQPGIYIITCTRTNKFYIGQTTNILNRLGKHAVNLINNKHECKILQTDFNTYLTEFEEFRVSNFFGFNHCIMGKIL